MTEGAGVHPALFCCALSTGCQSLILRSAERASREMKAPAVASPFETRADGALLRVRVESTRDSKSACYILVEWFQI